MRRHAGGARCGARAYASQASVRDASGHRPSQLPGAAFNGWTRVGRTAGKPAEIRWGECPPSVPGSTVPRRKAAAMERREARACRCRRPRRKVRTVRAPLGAPSPRTLSSRRRGLSGVEISETASGRRKNPRSDGAWPRRRPAPPCGRP
jgi:hypothetical protein